jgi:hypothetical protein
MSGTLALHLLYCHILFLLCIVVMEPFCLSLYSFSCCLKKILQVFHRDDRQSVGRLLFCLGIGKPLSLRSGLPLPYMLGLIVFSFPFMHVDFARFLLKFSAISCMSIYFYCSLCFHRICLHIIEILSQICAKFSCCIFTR